MPSRQIAKWRGLDRPSPSGPAREAHGRVGYMLRVAAAALVFGAVLVAHARPQAGMCGLCRAASETPLIEYAQTRGGAANTRGNFDFYVFSLSWWPGFCETPA